MDKSDGAASFHCVPCCDGAVDAAAEEADDFAGNADGKSAESFDLVVIDEATVVNDFDPDAGVGVDEVDGAFAVVDDSVSNLFVHVH